MFYVKKVKFFEVSSSSRPTTTTFQRAVDVTYRLSQIAAEAAYGAVIGGIAAATAPVSMPVYAYYLEHQKEQMSASASTHNKERKS